MRVKLFLIILGSAALLVQTGCSTLRPAPVPLPMLKDSAAYVQDALSVPHQPGMSGVARIAVSTAGGKRAYKTVFACRYPDLLRFEVLGLFNQPGLYISARAGSALTLYVPSENAWYAGPATPETMQRISGIRMDPFDMVRLLYGQPPGPDPAASDVSCRQDRDSYACTLRQGDRLQNLWISPLSGRVTRSRLFENGLPLHDIRFQASRQEDGAPVTESISIALERYATDIEIGLKDTGEAALTPAQILLKPPQDTVVLPIEALLQKN